MISPISRMQKMTDGVGCGCGMGINTITRENSFSVERKDGKDVKNSEMLD